MFPRSLLYVTDFSNAEPFPIATVLASLTEEDGEELGVVDVLEEEVPVDVLHRVLLHLVQQPSQELVLLARVACRKEKKRKKG